MGEIVPAYRWKHEVKRRDGYKCAYCGSTEKLEAHHIEQEAKNSEKAHDLDNGITLCRACHHLAHNGNYTTRKWRGQTEGSRHREISKFIAEYQKRRLTC